MNSTNAVLVVILILAVATAVFVYHKPPLTDIPAGVEAFTSEEDFKAYIEESAFTGASYYGGMWSSMARGDLVETSMPMQPVPEGSVKGGLGDAEEPSRISETNVQVSGIDEPDIVKTDGNNIYFSSQSYRYYWTSGWERPYYYQGKIDLIKAFPASELEAISKINKSGDLLLVDNTLIIFAPDKIYGYDVSDSENPVESWSMELNSSIVTARLYQGKVYLITRKNINQYAPCPIVPLTRTNGAPVEITCNRVYHPIHPSQTDITYNAIVFNPVDGSIEDSVSFVGSSWSSTVYMSENAIYVTYPYSADMMDMIIDFLKEKGTDLVPSQLIADLERINNYDIGMQAKMIEFQTRFMEYLNSLSRDEQMRIQNEFANRFMNYSIDHKREFTYTGIAKIGLDMEVGGAGAVPGTVLNQFSLDEYQGFLRVAVTVGSSMWGTTGPASANDIYVLDSGMNIVGQIQDLGLTERIYSARFIGDKGYLVTFRRIDPFYVLDLSDPTNPQMKGELKIPGYSSYLHPITTDKILGIGEEDRKVKISLFDVSDPANPTELSKYNLDDYYSEIESTHHAFLLDSQHEIFFLPGGKGGYIFSYSSDQLSLTKAVADISARRAIYIDDYLYIIGTDKIVVLDENTWQKVSELEISATGPPDYIK